MKHIGLFEGIGGFSLAANWMGWKTIAWCEINPFCQTVLKYHFPYAKAHSDIKQTDFTIYRGQCDILTGGFPCQPYSTAGKRLGKEDDRHLWPEMLRAVQEIQPSWIVGENVRGITNWNGGMVFDEVQADLEAEGYEVLPFLLPACAVNAPHRRDRIWFIAHNKNDKWNRDNSGFGRLRSIESLEMEASQTWVCLQNRTGEKWGKMENNSDASPNNQCAKGRRGGSYKQIEIGQQETEFKDSKSLGELSQSREGMRSNEAEGQKQVVCPNLYQKPTNASWMFRHEGAGYASESKCGKKSRTTPNPSSTGRSQRQQNGRWQDTEKNGTGVELRTERLCGDGVTTNPCDERLQRREFDKSFDEKRQERRKQPSGSASELYKIGDWRNFPTQSPVCGRNDGVPGKLDGITFSKWRNESIKAYGNAIVPQVAYQIFKAIEYYQELINHQK